MPKNKKPAGGRPAKNFEPRYGKNPAYQDVKRRPGQSSDGKPGSKSPGHRGYREDAGASGAKKPRWTAQERAGRDEARSIRSRGGSDRETRYERDDRPRGDRFERGSAPYRSQEREGGYGGGRGAGGYAGSRGERPSYGSAPRRNGERDDRTRTGRDDRGRFERDDRSRPARDDRGGYGRSRFERDDRPRGDRFERDDRPRGDRFERSDRPRFDRNDRGEFNRDDRSRDRRGDRAPFNRDDRPRFDRDDRNRDDRSRSDRPRFEDGDRPRYDRDRSRGDRSSYGRPDRNRDDRFGDRPRREGEHRSSGARFGGERAGRGGFGDRDRAPRPARTETAAQAEHVDVVHERLQAEAVDAATVAEASFAELGLGQNIVSALADLGAASPFPIQAATIAPILDGRDVLARGRTGSGKTIAFGAPLVEAILRSQAGKRREFGRSPRALILAPTRELALQIDRTVQPIARSVGLFTTQIYGGVPQARQVGALKKGVDIIIGTPGRIEDLQNQGKLDLSQVQIVVLDEADHMSELGFLEPMQRILRLVADDAQKLLFSATLDREVAALVDEFLVNPAVYEVAGETQESGTIDHRVLVIDHRDKPEILTSLVDREGKTLVFARTRAYAEMLAEQFEDAGIAAVALHGDLNQAKRTRNLQRMTEGRVRVLVATDVAARGIHVDDIDLVVQADAPDEFKAYLHRSGRTGRAGRSGTVVTLVPRQRRRRMQDLLDRAEIEAPFEQAGPGDDIIDELAGRLTLADIEA